MMIFISSVGFFFLSICTLPSAATASTCQAFGEQQSALPIDFQWVIQGRELGFTGFMVEFMGFSESIRNFFPNSRLVKSSFRQSYSEAVMPNLQRFLHHELFKKEGDAIEWLISNTQSKHTDGSIFQARPLFRRNAEDVTASVCDNSTGRIYHAMRFTERFFDSNYSTVSDEDREEADRNNLARWNASAVHGNTVESCCMACLHQPQCVAWTYLDQKLSSHRSSCVLKASVPFQKSLPDVKLDPNSPPPPPMVDWVSDSRAVSGRMLEYPASTDDAFVAPIRGRVPQPRVVVLHGTTCFHRNHTINFSGRDVDTIYIGRYMIERPLKTGGFDLNEFAVASCVQRVDEIWVPTEWHKQLFVNMLEGQGNYNTHVEVIEEAVDTALFDPVLASRSKVRDTMLRAAAVEAASGDVLIDADDGCKIDTNNRVRCASKGDRNGSSNSFEFLSIFKWEYRKAWDVLLDAYWTAFTPDDDVVLRLRTYKPKSERGDPNIFNQIEEHAQKSFGTSTAALARVVWETGKRPDDDNNSAASRAHQLPLTREEMRELLASADAFVLPTRGEGWGLPIAEAMSMALPVIVTNHSGPTAYATVENAYLIALERDHPFDELLFAKPDRHHLQQLMRDVIDDSTSERNYAAQMKGAAARTTMESITAESIVCKMITRIRHHARLRGWEFS